jgi:GH15 family glucan-1,4-alpha-glucosidase
MAAPLEDYALIGDGETVALVAKDGSIDWLCWPRFDSGACFAALLGASENGRWQIAPATPIERARQRYRGHTLILETEFTTTEGSVEIIDFMPPREQDCHLVRLVRGKAGRVKMRSELIIRFGYGAFIPWVTRLENGDLRAVSGPDMLVLRTPVELRGEGMTTVGEFTVSAGECVPFVLVYSPSHLPLPKPMDAQKALERAEDFWQGWIRRSAHAMPQPELVIRSQITLKALIYRPTGGIVAAPTTSLPERLGGTRNWDYRYCWLRDATFTLLALMNSGYYDEAKDWRDWLLRAAAGSPEQMQTLYGVAGERRIAEEEVPWLSGYENAKPVRIGNAAATQLQLDIFGEVMDALHHARVGGLAHLEAGWALQCALMKHLEEIWAEPDEGIWEVRDGRQHFTYSKVMAWVAFDRGIKSAESYQLEGPIERWRRIRDAIHAEVCRRAFNSARGAFTQAYDSPLLDASLLLIPAVGFLPPRDPRVEATVTAIERGLMREGLVLRYDTARTKDGLPPGEGAFLACSFWLADAYVMLGREQDALRLFERLCRLCNDVGLLAEEYDPEARRLVGNFPQAFSHVALVNTAHNLAHALKPAEQRSGNPRLTKIPAS